MKYRLVGEMPFGICADFATLRIRELVPQVVLVVFDLVPTQ